jgi:hypothetical protein
MNRRQRDKLLVSEVVRVLNKYDLSGLAPGTANGAPFDEYLNEALPIAGHLLRGKAVAREDVKAVWLKWFDNNLVSLSASVWESLLADLNTLRVGERP